MAEAGAPPEEPQVVLPLRERILLRLHNLRRESVILRKAVLMTIQMLLGSAIRNPPGGGPRQLNLAYPLTQRRGPNNRRPPFIYEVWEVVQEQRWIMEVIQAYVAYEDADVYPALGEYLFGRNFRRFRGLIQGMLNLFRDHITPQIEALTPDVQLYINVSHERAGYNRPMNRRCGALGWGFVETRDRFELVEQSLNELLGDIDEARPGLDPMAANFNWHYRVNPDQRRQLVRRCYVRLSRIYWLVRPLMGMVPVEDFDAVESFAWREHPPYYHPIEEEETAV